jgi:tRNA modification GTPase
MTFALDSTITAQATALGPAPRAVIRVCGRDAFDAVAAFFSADDAMNWRQRGVFPGTIRVATSHVRVWLWATPAPASYTGQHVVEVHLPAAWPILRAIESQLHSAGLRAAHAGEFTARAVMLGKLALTQAEAIDALIRAENDAQIDAAMGAITGALDHALAGAYDELVQLVTAIETNIDFSEEQIVSIPLTALKHRIDAVAETLTLLQRRTVHAESLARMDEVVLVGAANAGKSSLLNRLTGINRAICSPLAGTTRDAVHAPWTHRGRQAMLVDTAGLLADPSHHDALTQHAVARVAQLIKFAEIVLCVIDASQPLAPQWAQLDAIGATHTRSIAVVNKIDAVDAAACQTIVNHIAMDNAIDCIAVSAHSGDGLSTLAERVFSRLHDGGASVRCAQLALNARQRDALAAACESLAIASADADALARSASQFGYEIIGSTVQQALQALATLLGKDATENVLDTVFSTFCIGK